MSIARVASFVLASAAAVGISYALGGAAAARGALVGVAIAFGLVALSAGLLLRAGADPQRLSAVMLGGMIVSLVVLVGAMLVVSAVAPEYLVPSSLTSVLVYMVYRVFEATDVSRKLSSGTSPAESPNASSIGSVGRQTGESAAS